MPATLVRMRDSHRGVVACVGPVSNLLERGGVPTRETPAPLIQNQIPPNLELRLIVAPAEREVTSVAQHDPKHRDDVED